MTSEPERAGTRTDEQPPSQRRTFLDLLAMEVRRTFGLAAEVEMRDGGLVLRVQDGERSTAIGCDMYEGWWFTWVGGDYDGRTIAPVEDYAATACLVSRTLWPAQEDLS